MKGLESFQYLVFIWISCLSWSYVYCILKFLSNCAVSVGLGVCSPRCARSQGALTTFRLFCENRWKMSITDPSVLMTLQQPCRSAEVRGKRGSGGFPAHTGRS